MYSLRMGGSESKSEFERRSRRQYASPNNSGAQSAAIPEEFLSEHVTALLESQREAYDARIRELERNVASTVLNAQAISNVCDNSMQTRTAPSPGGLYPQLGPEQRSLSPAFESIYQEHATRQGSAYVAQYRASPSTSNYQELAARQDSAFYPGPSSNLITTIPSAPSLPSTSGPGVQKNNRMRPRNDRHGNNGSVCPTCKNKYGLSRLYQCDLGHSSCEDCKVRRPCGICRHPITDMRNITLEAALAETTEACTNAMEGCTLHFKLADMPAHEKECPFKDMSCPFYNIESSCNWKGKLSQLKCHFSDAHPLSCSADVDNEMDLKIPINSNKELQHLYLVQLGVFNFLLHCKIDKMAKMFYMAIQLIGTKVSSDKWTYNIQIYNKLESRRKCDYTDYCRSNSEDVKEIFKDYNCLSMPLDYALSFANNNYLNYKFYIKKNTENQRNQRPNRGRGGPRGRGKRPS